jgi:threonine aldolase
MTKRDVDAIFAACERFVSYHAPKSPRDELTELAEYIPDDANSSDIYGRGSLMENFEAQVAALLGKPAALFFPSGTMAQQIALRIWADRTGNRNVAWHPYCHLEVHEQMGYRVLHNLHGELVGNRYRLMTLDDLKAVRIELGALLLELPQRDLGGVLPSWDALTEMTGWAREQGIITHMDGARLWESKPFYGREYAEIAELFDTVYVSFYKALGGITGAALAGPERIINEARVWQRRHGGNLVHMYPFVFSAKKGLEEHLPMMDAYHEKAVEIAEALAAIPEIEVTPDPPHTNMMHLFVRGDADRLWDAALDVAQESKTWLTRGFFPCQIPAFQMTDLVVLAAGLDVPTGEIARLFAEVVRRAQ